MCKYDNLISHYMLLCYLSCISDRRLDNTYIEYNKNYKFITVQHLINHFIIPSYNHTTGPE